MAIFTAISAWATAVLGPGALTVFGLSPAVTSAIFTVGRAALWSLASAALTRPDIPRQQVQATITETDRPRVRAYGRNLFGGMRAFFEASDGELFQIVVMHHGRIDGLVTVWIDGEPISGWDNEAEGRIERYKRFYWRDGSGDGGDYTGIPARNLSDFPTLWTSDHRLEGQATFLTIFGDPADEDFAKVFPKGPNTQVQAEIRGCRVRDNSGSLVYSENAGFILRDLMTHPEGWGIASSRLDEASWDDFGDLCAETVPLAGGGTEPRYRLCGYYGLDEPLKDVTSRFLAVCDGQIYETADGQVGILGGRWSEPDVTITADDIMSVNMQEGFDPFTTYNVLRGSFVSPDHGYQPTEVGDLRDEASLAEQGERADQMDLDACPSHVQLQRLMEIKFAKDRRQWRGTIRTNLVGLKARFPKGDGIHTIRIQAEEFGIDGVFEVESHTFSIPDGFCEIGVASIENPYGWTTAEERPLPPTMAQIIKPDRTVPEPEGVVIVQEQVQISGGVDGVRLVLSVDDPGRDGLSLQAQIVKGDFDPNPPWVSDIPLWVGMSSSQTVATSSILDDGDEYTIRYRWRGRGDWIKAGPVTVVANPTQPDPPTELDAMVTGTDVYVDWKNAGTGYYQTQVLMGTTTDYGSASVIATVTGNANKPDNYTFDASAISGTRRFWVRTLNRSGIPSDPEGPVTVSI